jgi:hypothetical protein
LLMMAMPAFGLTDFATLLDNLIGAGYVFCPISSLRCDSGQRVVYMRHDIDFHLTDVDQMAAIESERNISSTYYVLLTQHYNPMSAYNRRILRRLADLGHEIGLHYDLMTYPQDLEAAQRHLDWEASMLASVTGSPVRSISMHQPFLGTPDPFRQLDQYVHPHDERCQQDLLYVSDSCRAWRDESLLACFSSDPPRRVQLLIHPELWQDAGYQNRLRYLEHVVTPHVHSEARQFLEEKARHIWSTHPGAHLHDERERKVQANRRRGVP